jgi:nitrogen fixation NifU-like protein
MDLRDLYQDIILDHYKKPRNNTELDGATCQAGGHNPLCGDRINVYLRLNDDGVVEEATFQGAGCAISTASASMMTEAVKGKKVTEVQALFERFHSMVTGTGNGDDSDLGKLEALAGVREIPIRVKCATLAWHTMQAALKRKDQVVSTEQEGGA